MIHDLDATLKAILESELNSGGQTIAISFDQPTRTWSNGLGTRSTVNLFLYDMRENNVLRHHHWRQEKEPNGNGRYDRKRTPFRFDCHYILTAWAKETEDQHRLLAKAMEILLRYPVLPTAHLQGLLRVEPPRSAPEIRTRLGSHDLLANPAELWSAVDNEVRLGISYLVTITFDPWEMTPSAPVVRTKRLTLQPHKQPENGFERVQIAGRLYVPRNGEDEEQATELPENVLVQFSNEERLYQAVVGENGRFSIPAIVPATYTMSAWVQTDGISLTRVGEKAVTVPPVIQVLTFANSFDLQVGTHVTARNLHLSPNQDGYIETSNLAPFTVADVTNAWPRTGLYYFGRDEKSGELTAVIPTTKPKQTSFRLIYPAANENLGNYDLPVEL